MSLIIRKAILICVVHFICHQTMAQDRLLYLRAGLSLFVAENKPGGDLIFFPGLTISPGIRLMNGDKFALSLSSPLSIGGSGNNLRYFGFDGPLMFDISLGSAAGNNDKTNFGVIMGAGVAYLYAENVSTDYNTGLREFSSADFFGPRFQFGFSFKKQDDNSAPMLLFSYGRSLTSTGHGFGRGSFGPGHVWGISFQMVMGRKKKTSDEAASNLEVH
ncbi:MAG TPA: hypothetical protein DGG95_17755 [Cytophagales bacterium]|jgi:hypothetical protein|nr:hypothetical protein [Cytophagales bacterium]